VEVEFAQVAKAGARLGCTNGASRTPSDAKATISAHHHGGSTRAVSRSNLANLPSPSEGRSMAGTKIDIEGTNGGIRIAAR
jgi:hypothetical protein